TRDTATYRHLFISCRSENLTTQAAPKMHMEKALCPGGAFLSASEARTLDKISLKIQRAERCGAVVGAVARETCVARVTLVKPDISE
ncbi:MAG: hypothetical protein ACP5O1_06390, partial [Phycisphaerae bacterium]